MRWACLVAGLLVCAAGYSADRRPLYALAVSPNAKFIATGGKSGAIVVHEAETGKTVFSLSLVKTINALAYSPNGEILAAGCDDRRVHLVAVGRNGLTASNALECRGNVLSVAFSPSGNLLAAGVEGSGNIHLFDIRKAKLFSTLWEPANLIGSLAFAPDDKTLASAGADFRVWDVRPGVLVRTASDRLDLTVAELRANERAARKWQATDGSEYAAGVAISSDGKRIAGVSGIGGPNTGGKTLKIWALTSGQRITTIYSEGMTTVAFSRDGQHVITASDTGVVSVWNPKTTDLERQWTAHSKAVRGIVVIPDSNQLATVGEDGALKVWDWSTGELKFSE
jgi:WD40 repeat protein